MSASEEPVENDLPSGDDGDDSLSREEMEAISTGSITRYATGARGQRGHNFASIAQLPKAVYWIVSLD
jgi:hypothetical protein